MTNAALAILARRRERQHRTAGERDARAKALAPTFKTALRHLADMFPEGLHLAAGRFGDTGDRSGLPRIGLDTARDMYRAGLVRFAAAVGGTFLHLTDKGRSTAATLLLVPVVQP